MLKSSPPVFGCVTLGSRLNLSVFGVLVCRKAGVSQFLPLGAVVTMENVEGRAQCLAIHALATGGRSDGLQRHRGAQGV